ncbi:hypothetical protein N8987_06340, partial [Crocinitomix sp.]|nr:hypothetical protein [Crocinitomix sp.]
MLRNSILICFISLFSIVFGQDRTNYYHLDKVTVKIKPSRDSIRKKLNYESAINQFKMNGYVGIHAKDTVIKNNNKHFYFEAESQFKKVELVDLDKIKNQFYIERDIYGAVNSINDRLIDLENTGFPFAQVNIVEQEEIENRLILNYKIDSGEFFIIDKINIKSKSDFHEKTVLSMIGLKVGDPYNEGKIRKLEEIFKN